MKYVLIICFALFIQLNGFTQFYASDFDNAIALQENQKFNEAIEIYSEILQRDSSDWVVLANRAICYAVLGNEKSAQIDFEKAMLISPNEPSLVLAVANFYAGEGKKEMAIQYFQNAQVLKAEFNGDSYFNYGSTYYVMGKMDSAKLYLELSWELDSTNSGVVNNLGWIHLESDPEKSCMYFNEAYKMDSLDASNVNNLGYSHLLCGNMETAFEYFQKSEELDPENSFVFRNYGLYYMNKNEKALAIENLNKALELGIVEKWGESYIEELRQYCEGK